MKKRAQQEFVGFVIIVVLVVVAALIFMVLSLKNKDVKNNSVEVGSLLDALLDQTTECVVREPIPLDIKGVIREAYGGVPSCKNSGVSTRDYLNSTIYETMENVMNIETRFGAWEIDVYQAGEGGLKEAMFFKGSCQGGEMIGADRIVGNFRIELSVCLNSYN